jgi:DNA-binding protein Fis
MSIEVLILMASSSARWHITIGKEAMRVTSSNGAQAATLLGFANLTTLTHWLKRHGVEP